MSDEKKRAAFEASDQFRLCCIAKPERREWLPEIKQYNTFLTQMMWESWQGAIASSSAAGQGEPVAWRVRGYARGYAQFKTGTPGAWRYVSGSARPRVNDPECCDFEPLYAAQPAPVVACVAPPVPSFEEWYIGKDGLTRRELAVEAWATGAQSVLDAQPAPAGEQNMGGSAPERPAAAVIAEAQSPAHHITDAPAVELPPLPLPTWAIINDKREIDDSLLDPVERFVFEYEPAGVGDDDQFRAMLLAALSAYATAAVEPYRHHAMRWESFQHMTLQGRRRVAEAHPTNSDAIVDAIDKERFNG